MNNRDVFKESRWLELYNGKSYYISMSVNDWRRADRLDGTVGKYDVVFSLPSLLEHTLVEATDDTISGSLDEAFSRTINRYYALAYQVAPGLLLESAEYNQKVSEEAGKQYLKVNAMARAMSRAFRSDFANAAKAPQTGGRSPRDRVGDKP